MYFFKRLVIVVVIAEMSMLICLWFLNFVLYPSAAEEM